MKKRNNKTRHTLARHCGTPNADRQGHAHQRSDSHFLPDLVKVHPTNTPPTMAAVKKIIVKASILSLQYPVSEIGKEIRREQTRQHCNPAYVRTRVRKQRRQASQYQRGEYQFGHIEKVTGKLFTPYSLFLPTLLALILPLAPVSHAAKTLFVMQI